MKKATLEIVSKDLIRIGKILVCIFCFIFLFQKDGVINIELSPKWEWIIIFGVVFYIAGVIIEYKNLATESE